MHLNGIPFSVYLTDTPATIVVRIAAKMATLPKWLVFVDADFTTDDFFTDKNILVVNYLERVRNVSTLTLPVKPYPPDVTESELQDVFIASNRFLYSVGDQNVFGFLFSLKSQLYTDPDKIWRMRRETLKALDKEIDANADNAAKLESVGKKLESISQIDFSPFKVTHLQFTVNMGHYGGNLLTLFNSVVLNSFVPYAACSVEFEEHTDLFKVYQDFRVNPTWINIQLANVLLLKVNCTATVQPQNVFRYYTSAAFTIDDQGTLLGTFDTIVSSEKRVVYLNKDEFIERVLAVFDGLPNKIGSSHDNVISSRFVFPNQCFDPALFADMIATDKLALQFVTIDEFVQPSRVTPNSAYVKYVPNTFNAISLTLRQTERPGEYGMPVLGSWYVLCRTRTQSTQLINPLQVLFSKLLYRYNQKFSEIAQFYKTYLSPEMFTPHQCDGALMLTKRLQKVKGRTGLRAIEPDIFFPHYTRLCSSPPTVVTEDVVGHQTMDFPVKGEVDANGNPYVTRRYLCPTMSHPFPGLRKNDLKNSKSFPYVPCCFVNNQTNRQGSPFRRYYFNEEKRSKPHESEPMVEPPIITVSGVVRQPSVAPLTVADDLAQNLFNTASGPDPGELENLPEQLTQFFKIIDLDPKQKYVRCGVRRNRYSAIEAVLYARGQIKYKKMRQSTVNNRVLKDVSKLLGRIEAYAAAAKQELYMSSISEIVTMLQTNVLVPSTFVRVLELLLDCNLFVFTAEAGLLVPNHSKTYLKAAPTRETFFLYEHSEGVVELVGSKSLYGHADTFGGAYFARDAIVKNVFEVFKQLSATYYYRPDEQRISEFKTPMFPSKVNVTGQVIDSYGKCRAVVVDDEFTLVLETPMPPFAAPIVDRLVRCRINRLKQRFTILWKRCDGNVCREVGVALGSQTATVLVNDTGSHSTIPTASSFRLVYENLEAESAIVAYQSDKREAYLLFQSTLNKLIQLLDRDFSKLNIEQTLRSYAKTNGPDTRLYYACLHWLLTHKPCDNVQLISSEMLKSPASTYLLRGIDAVERLVKTYTHAGTVVQHEPIEGTTPYYLKLLNTVYLAVPVSSLTTANGAIFEWKEFQRVATERKSDPLFPVFAYTALNKLTEVSTPAAVNVTSFVLLNVVTGSYTAMLML